MPEPLPVVEFDTNHGKMQFELFEDDVPNTVANFISLIESKFYDGTKSHRVIKGFMVQLGDPKTKDEAKKNEWGTGGPGYCIDCEWKGKGKQRNLPGTLSMAHAGLNTGGSQFFINDNDNGHGLDNRHTVFGMIKSGKDVLAKIMATPVSRSRQGEMSSPTQPILVNSVKVISKRNHPYAPVKNATVR